MNNYYIPYQQIQLYYRQQYQPIVSLENPVALVTAHHPTQWEIVSRGWSANITTKLQMHLALVLS